MMCSSSAGSPGLSCRGRTERRYFNRRAAVYSPFRGSISYEAETASAAIRRRISSGWAQIADPVPDRNRISPPVLDPRENAPINPVSLRIRLSAGFALGAENASIVSFVLLILLLALRPEGLLGRRGYA